MNKIPKFTDNGVEYIDLDTLEQKISSINENRLYHFTSFDNFIKIWLSKSLLFSKREGMNDIAEKEDIITGNNLAKMMAYLYAVREYKQISLSNAKVIHSNKKGTAIYQSPLMWGIYARNATGICIEFDKEKLLSKLSLGCIKSKEIQYLPYIPNNCLIKDLNIGSIKTINDARHIVDNHIDEIFFTKYDEWRFENEYRLISRESAKLDIEGLITRIFIYNGDSNQNQMLLNLISNQVEIKVAFLSCIFKDSRYINTYTLKENPTSYNNNSWEIEFERMLLTDQINKSNE